jgi:hypothetical protein
MRLEDLAPGISVTGLEPTTISTIVAVVVNKLERLRKIAADEEKARLKLGKSILIV